MDRRAFIGSVACGLLAAPLAAEAQPPPKIPRIGYLGPVSPSAGAFLLESFRQGLHELGYVEGQNILIDYRWAEGRPDRLPALAAELIQLRVDAIVTYNNLAVAALQQATRTIPIVMTYGGDPVASGLVTSLARPGGNVTGLTGLAPEIVGKQLELLKEMIPKVSRVTILWNPANQSHPLLLREAELAARSLRVQLQMLEVRGPDDFETAFAAVTRERASALLIPADGMFLLHRTRIADLAARTRLPAMYGLREYVDAGGLVVYAPSIRDSFRHAATYVDKILKGAKPGDLPVEQPTKFELVINLKTAKALGLTIPQSLLLRADELIQ